MLGPRRASCPRLRAGARGIADELTRPPRQATNLAYRALSFLVRSGVSSPHAACFVTINRNPLALLLLAGLKL